MKAVTNRLLAPACALTLPLCALAIWPVVELGVNDEWSYAKTVQVLAQSGHVVYNGWGAPILGWLLYLGAAFVKVFGFSFTVVRLSILLVAMATVALMHRVLVRCGINEWNATLGTLMLALSPLFLPLSFNFMTDVPGLFVVLLCLYGCLRALEAQTDNAALAWITFAVVSNALGGTVRQTTWLGVLVVVPSTLWLLRRRRRLVIAGGILCLASLAFIYGTTLWFHRQPYSLSEDVIAGTPARRIHALNVLVLGSLELALLLLPLLLFFIPAVPLRNRRALMCFTGGGLLWFAFCLIQAHRHEPWIAPYFENYISSLGIMGSFNPWHGTPPVVLSYWPQVALTCLLGFVTVCFGTVLLVRTKKSAGAVSPRREISWHHLGVLLIPVTLAYFSLLIYRAAYMPIFDRYMLLPLPLVLIPLIRYYQEQIQSRLPAAVLVPIGIYAAFTVSGAHDTFARYRASLAAIQELRAAGVPAWQIDGGTEYNGWNQIELARFIREPKVPTLDITLDSPLLRAAKESYGVCRPVYIDRFPAIVPRYGLAAHPSDCLGPAGFAPIQWRALLNPHIKTVYIVKVGRPDDAVSQISSRR